MYSGRKLWPQALDVAWLLANEVLLVYLAFYFVGGLQAICTVGVLINTVILARRGWRLHRIKSGARTPDDTGACGGMIWCSALRSPPAAR